MNYLRQIKDILRSKWLFVLMLNICMIWFLGYLQWTVVLLLNILMKYQNEKVEKTEKESVNTESVKTDTDKKMIKDSYTQTYRTQNRPRIYYPPSNPIYGIKQTPKETSYIPKEPVYIPKEPVYIPKEPNFNPDEVGKDVFQ